MLASSRHVLMFCYVGFADAIEAGGASQGSVVLCETGLRLAFASFNARVKVSLQGKVKVKLYLVK